MGSIFSDTRSTLVHVYFILLFSFLVKSFSKYNSFNSIQFELRTSVKLDHFVGGGTDRDKVRLVEERAKTGRIEKRFTDNVQCLVEHED